MDSFARRTIWGFEVAAEENGRILIDTHIVLPAMQQVCPEVYASRNRTTGRSRKLSTTTLTGDPIGPFVPEATPLMTQSRCANTSPLYNCLRAI